MTPEQFQRVSQIFLEARQVTGVHRDRLLRERCNGEDGLLAHVEGLLEADRQEDDGTALHPPGMQTMAEALRCAADGMLGGAAVEHDRATNRSAGDSDRNIGRRLGRYVIIERIGAGGMGAVYRAQQDEPQRIVALKIIRPGLVTHEMLRRFRHEAQLLGRLQHPGIAQIYEAGTDDAGDGAQPYFAMEFIDGQPLGGFLQQRDLDVPQRLDLLALICDAVEHAHQRGIIHRDLKPANVLVVENIDARADGLKPSCVPKVLDFGVGRAIDAEAHHTTLRRDTGQIVGTLAYMSPEQAGGAADDVDTRADVYALGAIGFEMLAGRPAHDLTRKSTPEALRTVMENVAPRLGTLHGRLRGDIETIIAHAMESEPARRYQSASALAADIRRYLRDEPIAARPPSAVYQMRKFAVRNKALVAGASIAVLALVAGVIGASIGLTRALDEGRKARRMNDYLRGMILFLDPSITKNNHITLRDVLDDASRRVDSELGGEPEVAAEILITIAGGYNNIVDYAKAVEHARRALGILIDQHGDDDPRLADVWGVIGQAHFRGDQPVEAEHAYRQALTINLRHRGEGAADTLGNIRDIIHLQEIQKKEGDTDQLVQIALRGAAGLPTHSADAEVGLALEAIGDVLATQHQMDQAEEFYRRAIDVLGRVRGSPYATEQCIVTMRNLSFLHEMQQRLDDAEVLERQAVDLSLKTYGVEHDVTLVSMNGLGRLLRATGQYDEAERVFRDAAGATRKMYGNDSLELAHDVHNLATVLRERNKYDEAIALFSEALAIRRRRLLQPDDVEIGRTLQGLGLCLLETGRGPEAVPLLREALGIRIKAFGEGHVTVAMVQAGLGAAVASTGAYEDAESLIVPAWEALGRGASPSLQSREREGIRRWLYQLYQAWGKPEKAAEYTSPAASQPASSAPTA